MTTPVLESTRAKAGQGPLRIAIVAGEVSGDLLGGALLSALRQRLPELDCEGIAGPRMQAQTCRSLYPLERLSVMGLLAILQRLPELLVARKKLIRHWQKTQPDVFIGIDAPEFNLGLELQLRAQGILTVHFVSPSVWAWREKRIFKIKRAVDLMLALFPFELPIYRAHQVRVAHVGHPLADQIPLEIDREGARCALNLPLSARIIAVLPGSRGSELSYLSTPFIECMHLLQQRDPDLHFVVPLANARRREQFESSLAESGAPSNLHLFDGRSHEVMAAADVVLLASGTATLEALLFKKPMIVAYKVGTFSYWLFKRLLKIKSFSLPNLLAGQTLVPELMQDDVNADALAETVWRQLHLSAIDRDELRASYMQIHEDLRCHAADRAADAIIALLRDNGKLS